MMGKLEPRHEVQTRAGAVSLCARKAVFYDLLDFGKHLLCRGPRFGALHRNRYSPDESQTGINVRVFPALLQERREVLTATSTSGNPNAWSKV